MKLRIGSRGSKLAVTQSHWVAEELRKKTPDLEISFREITTTGDRDQSATFQAAGGKGVFVKEIEDALLANEIDLAVHSLKDVPQMLPPGLILGPYPQREDVRDAFISRFGEQLHEMARGSVIGTSSPRRHSQIAYKFKKRGYRIEPLRGNIDTRLKKLQDGHYDGIVLAYAGLKRIGLENEITHAINPAFMLPAATQGCLGLEIRANDAATLALLETIQHLPSHITATAERAFLQGLGGNCNVPVGVFSVIEADKLKMTGILLNPVGDVAIDAEQSGPVSEPALVGYQLAERLLMNGGAELM